MTYDDEIKLLDILWENTEDEEWEIIQYLRQGGILFGDRIGAETPQDLTDPRHTLVFPAYSEPKPLPLPLRPKRIREETDIVELPAGKYRCLWCGRPFETFVINTSGCCSWDCRKAIKYYREELLTWMGIK